MRKTGTHYADMYPKYAMRKMSTHLHYFVGYQNLILYLNICHNASIAYI